jgi:hypothetical protein
MSNQLSAAKLNFRGDDARFDLSDRLVFALPESPGDTGLNFKVNPFMTGADFNHEAVHRVNVGNSVPVRWSRSERQPATYAC